MAKSLNPRQLIVEGHDDLSVIAELMGQHVDWPRNKDDAPVWVEIGERREGVDAILKAPYLSGFVKQPHVRQVGIVLDADEKGEGRYASILSQCASQFPDMPERLPSDGVVVDGLDAKRLAYGSCPTMFRRER